MQTKNTKQRRKSIIKAFLSAIISFILLSILYRVRLQHELDTEKDRYIYIANNQAEHIITAIDCVMSRTNTLKTLVKEHNGDTSWFDDVAEDLYTSIEEETGVSPKNFAIAPDGVVSDVYPLEGNEKLIGFDFLDTSLEGNLEAREAYEKGRTIITNPFNLIQGGIGMGGRASVLLQNGDKDSLWGLVTVTIDFDNLIDVIRLDNLHGMGADYSLSYIEPDGRPQFIYGDGDLGDDTVKARFDVRNLTWELAVKPSNGWYSAGDIVLFIFIILMLSCLVGLLIYTMIRLRENNVLLQHLSNTDGLTGCYNRMAYEEKIRELSAGKMKDDLIYVSADVNGLKQVNDTLGHAAGDELLSGATSCLQKAFGAYGSLYRTGGDEFVALIHADEETLAGIMEKVNSIMESWKGINVKELSISVGYASHREFPDLTMEELGRSADRKMYEAKTAYYQKHDRRRRT